MKTLIKLTDEYASNLNVLFLNVNKNVAEYYKLFASMFQDCTLSNSREIEEYDYSSDIDIVFIKMDNSLNFDTLEDMRSFMSSLRQEDELLPIYFIKGDLTNKKIIKLIDNCYCPDGFLPTPFDRDRIYRFLYRVLKRITISKELNSYVKDLEDQLFHIDIADAEEKPKKEVRKSIPRDKEREKSIRFSQDEKISSVDFMNLLDDGIVDKIENMEEELDSLIENIYDLENVDALSSVTLVRERIEPIIENVYILVESIGYFSVTAKAFESLKIFLATLTAQEFEDSDNKALLIQMLLAVINDLEKWLKVVFIEHSTEDIHYLDASFYSNVLEIENIFLEDDDDDDGLDFF